MHFCTATIAIGGDSRNTAVRDEYSPVSWPEIEVLRLLHGDDAVTDVRPFVAVEQPPRVERQRLADIYGEEPLQRLWGGLRPPSELSAPRATLAANTVWQNPLTHDIEITGPDGMQSAKAPPAPSQPVSQAETVGDMTRPPPATEPYEADDFVAADAGPPRRRR
jgi:hypothetical protein